MMDKKSKDDINTKDLTFEPKPSSRLLTEEERIEIELETNPPIGWSADRLIELVTIKQDAKTASIYQARIGALIENTLRDFSQIPRERGHPRSYWAGYHYARNLMLSALKATPKGGEG